MTRRQTGLMVLRVWTEEGSTEPLRVDIRHTRDLSGGFRDTRTVTDVDGALAAVRRFLETDLAARAAGANGGG